MKKGLSEEQVNMIDYYYKTYGDFERWSGWKEALKVINKHHPELLNAITQLKIAQQTLDAIVNNLESTWSEDDYDDGM